MTQVTQPVATAPTAPTPPKDYALLLGGSSKKHTYIANHFDKYNDTKIHCQHLYTSQCHKYGYQTYANYFRKKNMRIVAICPLMDSLIPFTDTMNTLYNLPHNDPKTSQIRRNKALMHQTLNKNSANATNTLRYAKFFEINNYLISSTEFENNMKKCNLNYPIVIKPPTSGGTDGVRLCYTFSAAKKVVQRYLFKENGEKNKNVTMMCQEFLNGEEYVVNTVSYNSNHKFTDIWRAYKTFIVDKTKPKQNDNDNDNKDDIDKDKDNDNDNNDNDNNGNDNKNNDNKDNIDVDNDDNKDNDINNNIDVDIDDDKLYPYSMLYDYQEFMINVSTDNKMKLIIDYVSSVLDALGVQYGCGHTEVMYLPNENKVCLIELNARMHGGMPRAYDLVGYDQLTLLSLSHCNSTQFVNEIPKVYNCLNKDKFMDKTYKSKPQVSDNDDTDNDDDDNKNIQNDNKQQEIVRAIFLRSKVNGKMNFNKLIQLKQLKTFKFFARTLYRGVDLWLEYQMQIAFASSKLKDILDMEQQRLINNDNDNVSDKEKQLLKEQKDDYNKIIKDSKRIIDRIEEVEKTIDLISCPGTIVLQGMINDIQKDYQQIRDLENDLDNGLFIQLDLDDNKKT